MLPKNLRLPRCEIKAVLKNGNKYHASLFSLVFLPDKKLVNSVWLIRVFKKNHPLATARNKTKRIIRETLRQINPQLKTIGKGIITVSKPMNKFSKKYIHDELVAFFQKIHFL